MMMFDGKNPTFNAYLMARYLKGHKKIRILSISPNEQKPNLKFEVD